MLFPLQHSNLTECAWWKWVFWYNHYWQYFLFDYFFPTGVSYFKLSLTWWKLHNTITLKIFHSCTIMETHVGIYYILIILPKTTLNYVEKLITYLELPLLRCKLMFTFSTLLWCSFTEKKLPHIHIYIVYLELSLLSWKLKFTFITLWCWKIDSDRYWLRRTVIALINFE